MWPRIVKNCTCGELPVESSEEARRTFRVAFKHLWHAIGGFEKGDERETGGGGLKDITSKLKWFWARNLLGKSMDGRNYAAVGGGVLKLCISAA